MGTWGSGIFDGDSAGDWVQKLEKKSRQGYVLEALYEAGSDELDATAIDEDAGAEALAAAELVAAASGHPAKSVPEEITEWVATRAYDLDTLREFAASAVQRVRDHSLLRKLWDEGDPKPWLAHLDDLHRRLLLAPIPIERKARSTKTRAPLVKPGDLLLIPLRKRRFVVARVYQSGGYKNAVLLLGAYDLVVSGPDKLPEKLPEQPTVGMWVTYHHPIKNKEWLIAGHRDLTPAEIDGLLRIEGLVVLQGNRQLREATADDRKSLLTCHIKFQGGVENDIMTFYKPGSRQK